MIYIICPVRNITKEQQQEIEEYVYQLENKYNQDVHYPPRDVNQDDETGFNICNYHLEALKNCQKVHIFWDNNSKGSHFDLGMAFALGKKIKLIKAYQQDIKEKSYLKVIKCYENSKGFSN